MIASIVPCLGLSLLIFLPFSTILAQQQESISEQTGLQAQIQAALAAEDNALTQEDLQKKLQRLTAERAKLKDFLQNQETDAKKTTSSVQETLTTAQRRQALSAEQDQLQADLTTNEAKLTQLRQQLETAEDEEISEINEAIKQIQNRNAAIKARLQEIATALAEIPERTHTVQAGESLSTIANRYYGDIQRWRDIFEVNRSLVTNPDVIEEDMVLVIP